MSGSDHPPKYDPLHAPAGGDHPVSAAYESKPARPIPPMYPGPPRAFPPGRCPGPPSSSPVNKTNAPSDVGISGDEVTASFCGYDSLTHQQAFITKAYLVLLSQLLVMTTVVVVSTFIEPVRTFVWTNRVVCWASLSVYSITHLVLFCYKGPRRRSFWNIVPLVVSTLTLSFMTGFITSYYDTKSVFLALGITAFIFIAVTVFCFQTKVNFTDHQLLLYVPGVTVLVTGLIATIVLSFQYIQWLHILYAAIGAAAFTTFLAFQTQLLKGNRKKSISPEEYVVLFLFLLHIIGASANQPQP